jgi:aspartate/methionine/tyrosine aminotransferase
MLEVCATTLPQRVLPKIFQSAEYQKYTEERIEKYKKRAEFAHNIFKENENLIAPKPDGAFYYTIVFKKNILKENQKLKIENSEIQKIIDEATSEKINLDKRFVYNLMGATGIVSVPLSGFNSEEFGFRITLLQEDDELFENTILKINEKINEYLNS